MARKKHSPLLDFLTQRAWALEENVLSQLTQVVLKHANGMRVDEDEVEAIVAARDAKKAAKPAEYEMRGSTAIIPINGVIAKHASQVNDVSQPQGTSTLQVSAMLKQAVSDQAVKSILLAIDSPGGSIEGVQALADEIHAARGKKPVVAHADGTMASAAYWLGSQADEVYATADSSVGSIGVYTVINDLSRLYKNEGVDVNVVRNGRVKGAGVRGTPVTGEQVAAVQRTVDEYAGLFHEAVMRGRGMTMEQLAPLADGSTFIGKKAKEAGLVDEIATLDTVLASLGGPAPYAFDFPSIPTESFVGTGTMTLVAECSGGPLEILETNSGAQAAEPQPAGVESSTEAVMNPTTNAVPAAPGAELSADALKAAHPTAAASLLAAGAQAERTRISAIRNLGVTGQESLVERLIADGSSETDALRALHADLKGRQGQGLRALIDSAPKSPGAAEPLQTFREGSTPPDAAAPAPTKNGERNWLAEAQAAFAKNPNLRHEYGDAETLAKWNEGAAKGAFGPAAKREVI